MAAACGASLFVGAASMAQTTPAAISDDIVRLGLILDMSGIYADVTGKGSATAAQMAIDDFGGKVLGRKIDLMVVDHQNKADIAAARAREWYDTQKVDAILDVAGSAPALAVLEVAREKRRSWCSAARAPSASPTTCARRIRCTTPTTPGRWPTPPPAPPSTAAARAGTS